jgi:hypothetical protein
VDVAGEDDVGSGLGPRPYGREAAANDIVLLRRAWNGDRLMQDHHAELRGLRALELSRDTKPLLVGDLAVDVPVSPTTLLPPTPPPGVPAGDVLAPSDEQPVTALTKHKARQGSKTRIRATV